MSTPLLDAMSGLTGLSRLYPMNETTGITAFDLSANEVEAAYQNGPALNQAPITQDETPSVLFDGINDRMVEADGEGPKGGNTMPPITVGAIFRPLDLSTLGVIVGWYRRNNNNQRFLLGISSGGDIFGSTSGDATEAILSDGVTFVGDTYLGVYTVASSTSRTVRIYNVTKNIQTTILGESTAISHNSFGANRRIFIVGMEGRYYVDPFHGNVSHAFMQNAAMTSEEWDSLVAAMVATQPDALFRRYNRIGKFRGNRI